MSRKSDTAGKSEDVSETSTPPEPRVEQPVEQIITLKLRQRAYWRGELCEAGTLFDYPKVIASEILTTTELFDAV
jgi:hypothetical protein